MMILVIELYIAVGLFSLLVGWWITKAIVEHIEGRRGRGNLKRGLLRFARNDRERVRLCLVLERAVVRHEHNVILKAKREKNRDNGGWKR